MKTMRFVFGLVLVTFLPLVTAAMPRERTESRSSNSTDQSIAQPAVGLGVDIIKMLAERGVATLSKAAGENMELADRLFCLSETPQYAGQAGIFKRFDAMAVNFKALDQQRKAWDLSQAGKTAGKVSTTLSILQGLWTTADRYSSTGDALYSIGAGAADGVLGMASAPAQIGCGVADRLGLESQKPLCEFLEKRVFSPDYYAGGIANWLGEGVSGAVKWSAKPDPVGGIVGAGDWARRGTKGALESAWDLGTGLVNSVLRGATTSPRTTQKGK